MNIHTTCLAQDITLSGEGLTLEQVFTAVKKQTGYMILGRKNAFSDIKKVSLTVNNMPLTDFLDLVLQDQPLKYVISGKTVFVSRKSLPSSRGGGPSIQPAPPVRIRVIDSTGKPLMGASVSVKNSRVSGVTDAQGEIDLNLRIGDIVEITFLGFSKQSIVVRDSTSILNVVLRRKAGLLDEVIFRGYYSTSRRLSTASVSKVTAEVMEKQPVTNPLYALQGRVAGLQIVQESGLPGAPVTVRIRGRNSIAAGNNPLFIVDGVPMQSEGVEYFNRFSGSSNGSPLNAINPKDIASIEILKDADAIAIYGSRGANGVILVTTRQGQAGDTRLELELSSGLGTVAKKQRFLSTPDYLQMRRDALANAGQVATVTADPDLLLWDQQKSTDWQDYFLGNTLHRHDAFLTLSGGTRLTTFRLSGNYHYENTVQKTTAHFDRASLHTSIRHQSENKRLQLQFNSFFTSSRNKLYGATGNVSINAIKLAPNYPVYDENGNYYWHTYYSTHPLANLEQYTNSNTITINSGLTLSYQVLKGLQLKANIGYNNLLNNQGIYTPVKAQHPSLDAYGRPYVPTGNVRLGQGRTNTVLFEPQLNYTAHFGNGTFSLLAGGTVQQTVSKGYQFYITGYTDDQLIESMQFGQASNKFGISSEYRYISAFSRIGWNQADKYLLNINLRRDGSSRFGSGKQFGNFGGIGAAWIMSNEPFFRKALPWISYAKLRGSYGTTGNDAIGNYGYLSLYKTTVQYDNAQSIVPGTIANEDFRWEVSRKFEMALETGFLNDRLLLTVAHYRNISDNQLVGYPVPSYTGFTSYQANLPATVRNTGWEVELVTTNIDNKHFTWTSAVNVTIPRNVLTAFPNLSTTSYAGSYVIGQSLGIVQLYHYKGIDKATGLPVVEDVNNDGRYTMSSSYNNMGGDYIISGTTDPRWYGGLSNSFRYGGFEVEVFFQYVRQSARNGKTYIQSLGRFNANTWYEHLGYQTDPEHHLAPYSSYQQAFTRYSYSDATFSDASFLRLKNVSIQYRLPEAMCRKLAFSGGYVYVRSNNVFTITPYFGYDPETTGSSSGSSAVSYFNVPPVRMTTAGIHLTF